MYQFLKENGASALLVVLLVMVFAGAWHASKWSEPGFFQFCVDNFKLILGALLMGVTPGVRSMLARKGDTPAPPAPPTT